MSGWVFLGWTSTKLGLTCLAQGHNAEKNLWGFYFCETSHKRSFLKIKSSRNGKITLSFTDYGKSCPSRDFLAPQIGLIRLFVKILRIYSTDSMDENVPRFRRYISSYFGQNCKKWQIWPSICMTKLMSFEKSKVVSSFIFGFGPRHDKTCLQVFWLNQTQTSLLSYRD